MIKKLNIVVLMGGNSPEYEISIASGKNILKNIDKEKYSVFPVVLSKNGKDDDLKLLVELNKQHKIDVCFIAMHGPYGEDGSLQKKLDKIGICYTGSGYKTSRLGMNKINFKKLMWKNRVITVKHVVVKKGTNLTLIKDKIKYPCFVKPANQGSSVGAGKANNVQEFRKVLTNALKYDDTVLIEEYVSGTEITVPILGNSKPVVLPIIEIRPKKSDFFDYQSKYTNGGSDEIVPALISNKMKKKVEALSERIYKLCQCSGFARIDFIIKDNVPYVLEINTIPGLTKASLFPKSAFAANIVMTSLIDKIINYAQE